MKESRPLLLLVSALTAAVLLGCVCALCGIAGLTFYQLRTPGVAKIDLATETVGLPTASPPPVMPTPESTSTGIPAPTSPPPTPGTGAHTALVPLDTLNTFETTIVPINDPIDLARRLQGKQNLSTSRKVAPAPLEVGARDSFYVMNMDTIDIMQVDATLRYVTDHVYFWIQEGVQYRETHLRSLAETFENEIYPTDREFFGSEWTPGVDADPHIYILYARDMGGTIAGYFSSPDEYLPTVHEYSNAHEMFVFNSDNVALDEAFAYSVLAHEFQHMIHWYIDRNEDTWMNEGFGDLAAFVNGYSVGGHDHTYVSNPDIQLTDWPSGSGSTIAHYGASFLFLNYFLGRFGEEATQALVADEANGMTSIDEVLAELDMTDPLTGEIVGADDVFADWAVASYLQDDEIADGRFTYPNYPSAPSPSETESIDTCSLSPIQRDVRQYGVDYIRIRCDQDFTLRFEAPVQVAALPADPYSGAYAFYSNRGDESDMTLTRAFDFTDHQGPLTLSYWTWYDLEEDYDYLYLEASEDGENWQILITPSGTPDDPSGNSYGWAYNGFSGDGPAWIQEEVDISQFAGKEVQLRFEYVTDAAVNGEGLLIDDVAVPQVNYFADFEGDNGGWEANGFVRIQNILPQSFQLSLIRIGSTTTVERIALPATNRADIAIENANGDKEIILVVSGTTRHTTQPALYQLGLLPPTP